MGDSASRSLRFHRARLAPLIPYLLIASLSLLAAPAARAHPMGNFSISHHTSFSFDVDALTVRYRLDFAEIPSVEEMRALDGNGNQAISMEERLAYLQQRGEQWARGLTLSINGDAVSLAPVSSELEIRPGAADLPTFLVTFWFRVPLPQTDSPVRIDYADGNFSGRAGWREIIAAGDDRFTLIDSTVPAVDKSSALTEYPSDLAIAPPQDHRASFSIIRAAQAAAAPPTPPASTNAASPRQTQDDSFARLITIRELSAGVVAASLGLAFILGAFHALSPGHGKTVVAAYLVGSRGTPRHAFLLGTVVTITHTAGVFALGLAVFFASAYIVPEQLYPWLGFLSGIIIVFIGLRQFLTRYAAFHAGGYTHSHGDLMHSHGDGQLVHSHGGAAHSHHLPDNITLGGLIALGVSGGLVPCPSALVVLLSSIAFNKVGFGLVLIIAFSMGLAAILICIGLLMLYARRLVDRYRWEVGFLQRLPLISPLVVAGLGLAIALQALLTGGIVQVRF